MCAISCAGVNVLAISRAVSKDMRAVRPWETSMVVLWAWQPPCVVCAARQPLSAFLRWCCAAKQMPRSESRRRRNPSPALRRGGRGALRLRPVPWSEIASGKTLGIQAESSLEQPRDTCRVNHAVRHTCRLSSQILPAQGPFALQYCCRLRRLGEPFRRHHSLHAVAAQAAP